MKLSNTRSHDSKFNKIAVKVNHPQKVKYAKNQEVLNFGKKTVFTAQDTISRSFRLHINRKESQTCPNPGIQIFQQVIAHCRTRFEKKPQYRNYEPSFRYIWYGIIHQIKKGIDIDDLGPSEPFSGSSLFQYGWKKSTKPRFSNFTKIS